VVSRPWQQAFNDGAAHAADVLLQSSPELKNMPTAGVSIFPLTPCSKTWNGIIFFQL